MFNMALVSIFNESTNQWKDLPCPSSYKGTSETLVDSARNSKGEVIASVIASDVSKVEMSWNYLTREQFSFIAKLFEPKYGGAFFVKVRYFDEVKDDYAEKIMYCGNRVADTAKITLKDGKPVGYTGTKLSLIDTLLAEVPDNIK